MSGQLELVLVNYRFCQNLSFKFQKPRKLCRKWIVKTQQSDSSNASKEILEQKQKVDDSERVESLQELSPQEQNKVSEGLQQVQTRRISINDIPKQYQRQAKKSAKKAQYTVIKQSSAQMQQPPLKQTKSSSPKYSPKVCSEAISMGLQEFEKQHYKEAIELFTASLDLPGNGAYRFADSYREYSCPSDGEEQAAMYNLTCCYAKLGQLQSAIICLEGLMESGFQDFQQLRTDPDLKFIQSTREFNDILTKFDSSQNFIGKLFRGNQNKEDEKPGLLW